MPNLVSGMGEVSNQQAANSGLSPGPVAVTISGPNPCFAIELNVDWKVAASMPNCCFAVTIDAERNRPIAFRRPRVELLLVISGSAIVPAYRVKCHVNCLLSRATT